jgi:hypothetical protein
MRRTRFSGSVAVSFVVVALLTGCGSSSSSSSTETSTGSTSASGDKATFCQDNSTIDKATSAATTPDKQLAALKDNQSTITDFANTAPSDIKTQADVLVSTATDAISANSAAGLSDPKFVDAGKAVDAYCGQQSNGEPIAGGSSSTTTP